MTQVIIAEGWLKLVRLEMSLEDFPRFLIRGIGTNGRLGDTEASARGLVAADFQPNSCCDFVRSVCKWGGDTRRAGKVIKRNRAEDISAALKSAYRLSIEGQIESSLEAVMRLEGLAVSFGSKHLKFLAPDHHVVLDRIISERLGYARNPPGYRQWLACCHEFLKLLRETGVAYPGIGPSGWRVADVEMAIFNKILDEQNSK